MTRFLSDSLQAPEPFFRLGLRRLEAAHNHPNTDIRFSTQVRHATQYKLKALGLDPQDTTPEELYHVLQERLKADDARLTKRLRTQAAMHVSAEGEIISGMVHILERLPDSRRCFALKNSSLKTILKKNPPKKAMKQLGYRSVDSFLKHEPPVSALAAAYLVEGNGWRQRLLDRYKQLRPSDFEQRDVIITQPHSRRWRELADSAVARRKHNFLSFKELGALVFLPLPADIPSGTVTASLSLALHGLNQIRASGTFLQLCQVRPDFGSLVRSVASDEPQLGTHLLDQPLSWQLIQRYYADVEKQPDAIPDPHLRPEEMAWHPIEHTLSAIEPALEFWKDSAHLGLLHNGELVSLNIVDAALNHCNQLPFERRIAHYFRQSLWHELLLKYLDHGMVEAAITGMLQPKLAEEMAVA